MPGLIPSLINLFQQIKDPDKQKREAALGYYAANPGKFQELANSGLSDDPRLLKQIFGDNARFGGDSNALSNIQDNLYRQPLSDIEQTNRLAQLGGSTSLNDVANASKGLPQLRAVRGQEIDPSKIGSGEGAFLNDQQKDIRAKFLGLPTARENKESDLRIRRGEQDVDLGKQALKKGEQDYSAGTFQLDEAKRKAEEETARVGRTSQARKYILQNKSTPYKLYQDKNAPAEIKQGIFDDPGMKAQFDAEQDQAFKDAQLKLQKDATGAKHDLDFLLQKSRVDYAVKVGEKFGADPEDVLNTMKAVAAGQDLDKLMSGTDPKLQKGSIALKSARDLLPQQQIRSAANDFSARNQERFDEVNDVRGKNLDKPHKVAVINQINQDARSFFGSMGIKPPVWGYGKEGDKTQHTFLKVPTGFKSDVAYIVDPGDEQLGYTPKNDKKETKPSESDNEAMAQSIINALDSGADISKTMTDPRMTPEIRALVMKKRGAKK